jgi:hypothetical protein
MERELSLVPVTQHHRPLALPQRRREATHHRFYVATAAAVAEPALKARSAAEQLFTTVDEAMEADRQYFEENPARKSTSVRLMPGEFGAAGLPVIPPGFRYATLVTVIHRTDGHR